MHKGSPSSRGTPTRKTIEAIDGIAKERDNNELEDNWKAI